MYRRSKEGGLNAIGYEIEMLRYCREQIQAQDSADEPLAASLYIEGFLLHFRNLIRFFSGKRPRPYDLSTADPGIWAGRPLTDDEVMLFKVAAEPVDDDYYQTISKYLQHCTELPQKAEHEWNINGMFEEIDPLIREFERRFLDPTLRAATTDSISQPATAGAPPKLPIDSPGNKS